LAGFYLKLLCLLFIGFMAYGHLAPWLISSKDTILCIAGFFLLATMPVYAWLILKWVRKVISVLLKKALKREN